MLISLLAHIALAGGPGPWSPSSDTFDPVTPPVTVHIREGVPGYTRVELTSHLWHELAITIQLTDDSPDDGPHFSILPDQHRALCESLDPDSASGKIATEQCTFIMKGGTQKDVLVTFPQSGTGEDEIGEVTIMVETPEGGWVYTVEKLIIGQYPRSP